MRILIAGWVAGLAALALAAAAPAATMTFDGSCTVTGIAKFAHPLSGPPAANHYNFDSGSPDGQAADATACQGTLNGARVNSPAKVHVDGDGQLSCAYSTGTGAKGVVTLTKGTATTADDTTVPFTLDIQGILTEVQLTVHGSKSGGGSGSASFRDYAQPTTPVDCTGATGGVQQLGFSASFQTDTPMVSEESPAASAGPAGATGTAPSDTGSQSSSEPSSSRPASQPGPKPKPKAKPKPKKKHKAKKKKRKKHKRR